MSELLTPLRRGAAGALALAGGVLAFQARLLTAGAALLRPDEDDDEFGPHDEPAVRPEPATVTTLPTPTPPPVVDPVVQELDVVLEDGGRVSAPESHIAEVAGRPAAAVVRAIADMSTDELEALIEYEAEHRNRKSVLAAIARAVAPPATDPGNAGLATPIIPDELVYSTETPSA